jgi:hypothetical protein
MVLDQYLSLGEELSRADQVARYLEVQPVSILILTMGGTVASLAVSPKANRVRRPAVRHVADDDVSVSLATRG